MPGAYIHYEPWFEFGIIYIWPPFKEASSALRTLRAGPPGALKREACWGTLTSEELRHHHVYYFQGIESENGVLAEDNETQWLVKACSSLNNLETVAYAETLDNFSSTMSFAPPPGMKWNALIPIAQQTLVDPAAMIDLTRCALSFLSLLEAVYWSPGQIKSLEAAVTWRMFELIASRPTIFLQSVKALRQLTLEVSTFKYQSKPMDSLAEFVASASLLQTLELSFPSFPSSWPIKLDPLFQNRTQWPSLHKVRFVMVSTRFGLFKSFLEAHAQTLRSLELSGMELYRSPQDQNDPAAPWVSVVQLLRETPNLTHVSFEDVLSSDSEKWFEHDYAYHGHSYISRCLSRKEVERYILHGGENPLQFPGLTEELSRHG